MSSNELKQAQEAFARHYVSQAEEAARQLWGPDHQRAEAFIRCEGGNCIEALRVLLDSDRATGLRFVAAIFDVVWVCGAGLEELLEWAERYHEACADMPPSPYSARLAFLLGWGRHLTSASPFMSREVGQCWEEAIGLARASGDLATLGVAQVCRGMAGDDLSAEARAALARDGIANARASGRKEALANALMWVATGYWWSGKDFASRKKDMEEALAIAEGFGVQPLLVGCVNAMGRVYAWEKMYADAEPWFLRAEEMARNLGKAPLWFAWDLPQNYIDLGQLNKARTQVRETFSAALGIGEPKLVGNGLLCCILLAFAEGKHERGAKLYKAWLAQVSPAATEPPPEHLAFVDEASRKAIKEFWPHGQPMSLDEAIAFAKEDW